MSSEAATTHEYDVDTLVDEVQDILWGWEELLNAEVYPLDHPLAGHCYVASEAVFHLTGGYDRWTVARAVVEVPEPLGGTAEFTHWFLRDSDGTIVDPTAEQFTSEGIDIPYESATNTGFLTSEPSNRTEKVLEKLVPRGYEL